MGHLSVDILQPAENKANKVAKSGFILLTLFPHRDDNLWGQLISSHSLGCPTPSYIQEVFRMVSKTQQVLHPYLVRIETPTGTSTTLPHALLTPKQAEELQAEFKRLAQDAGVKGARISVQRASADDYEKVIHEAKACLRNAIAKAA